MVILGFVWLVLLVVELVYGDSELLQNFGIAIWGIFIVDFIIKFSLAPMKGRFLKSNVLIMISLAVPAFRVFRIFRILRVLRISRSFRLVKIIGSLNRGMRALSVTMKRRAFGYVVALTLIVIFGGAAGMYAFERNTPGGLEDYGAALWWTTMIITTWGPISGHKPWRDESFASCSRCSPSLFSGISRRRLQLSSLAETRRKTKTPVKPGKWRNSSER